MSSAALVTRDLAQLLGSWGRHVPGSARVPWSALLLWILLGGPVYGAVMGSYGGSVEQALYSAIKVPLLLATSTLICLPNFFALNTVLGLREDFRAACRGVLASQATAAVTLLGLAPVVGFVYFCGCSYPMATITNGLLFLAASVAGQVTLERHYRPLIARRPRHRVGLMAWLGLYIFVAVQAAWLLRPFIGWSEWAPSFLRADALRSNAYVEVVSILAKALRGF